MNRTRRITQPIRQFTSAEAEQGLKAGRHAGPDPLALGTGEFKLSAAKTVKLGASTSDRWRDVDLKLRSDVKKQARETARALGVDVRVRLDNDVLVYTARGHAER